MDADFVSWMRVHSALQEHEPSILDFTVETLHNFTDLDSSVSLESSSNTLFDSLPGQLVNDHRLSWVIASNLFS
jgi:hypothetical protein